MLRDFLWNYPNFVITSVKRSRLFWGIVLGTLIGGFSVLLVSLFTGFSTNRQLHRVGLTLGFVGNIDYINPLDINSDESEKMLISLIYDGLVRIEENGNRINPDIADTWEVTPDGRHYRFYLKKGILWHDGVELTASDVEFTYSLLKSSTDNSGYSAMVKDVKITVLGPYQIEFELPQINAAFFELMTIPIMPEHIYGGISYARLVEQGYLFSPIGTGIYKVDSISNNNVILSSNEQYFRETPKIKSIKVISFPTYELAEAAFLSGDITMLSPIPASIVDEYYKFSKVSKRIAISSYSQLNNTRVLLFNLQDEEKSLDLNVRKAIASGINRKDLILESPGSIPAFGPYSPASPIYSDDVETFLPYNIVKANEYLEKAKWQYDYSGALYRSKENEDLVVTITFLDTPTNQKVGIKLKEQLKELGINITLEGVSSTVFQQKVVSQHEFQVLLFEIQNGVDPDQYGLWHSSQTDFPGLNIGGFDNSDIDILLEKGRLQLDLVERQELYTEFQEKLIKEAPVIFLYHPAYFELYYDFLDREVSTSIVYPEDRFEDIGQWNFSEK